MEWRSIETGDWTHQAGATLSIILMMFFRKWTILQGFCGQRRHFVIIPRKSNCIGLLYIIILVTFVYLNV